jgi:hypothetical protein
MDLTTALTDVANERARQDEKWGEQNHGDADPVILARLKSDDQLSAPSTVALRLATEYEVPSAARGKWLCERERTTSGAPTWAGIALEEFCEVIEAIVLAKASGDDTELRAEVIQTAAVFVAWAAAIDRRHE